LAIQISLNFHFSYNGKKVISDRIKISSTHSLYIIPYSFAFLCSSWHIYFYRHIEFF